MKESHSMPALWQIFNRRVRAWAEPAQTSEKNVYELLLGKQLAILHDAADNVLYVSQPVGHSI
jgi:hypothetical protein